jgi:hypothetical protein
VRESASETKVAREEGWGRHRASRNREAVDK